MTIQPGTRLGPYEIVSSIGAGGMGEVWRARDTRLDREVAIKVLPPGFAENEQLRQRFEREAKAISQLNHPNVCTLFDVGHGSAEGGGQSAGKEESAHREPHTALHYLVMEYLEGESLADRIKKGPLPLHEVLKFGQQIASALDAAHRQGITHRDLKPGNIMLTKSGAKLLDFGLAKTAAESPAPIDGLTNLPTEAKPLTQEGTILGTFQYMAPEQLEGLEADARTDIFALGTVLYEMATGHRAFQGGSKTSLIAAIVSSQPAPISSVVAMTPPALDHVVRKCLEKGPDDRWQSAHDLGGQLQWISEAGSQAGVAAPVTIRRKTRERLAWALAGIATALVIVFASLWFMRAPEEQVAETAVWSVVAPDFLRYDFGVGGLAISPDGHRIAYLARGGDGEPAADTRIWIRDRESMEPHALEGTNGAIAPFWSPDSRYVGFFADGKLKRIDASGGPAQILADAPQPRGGTWSRNDTIIFCPAYAELHILSLAGGEAEQLTTLREGETNHRWPVVMPDGKYLLYLAQAADRGAIDDQSAIYVRDLDSGEEKRLIETNSAPLWSPPGTILFWKEGFLLAQSLDLVEMSTRGQPFPVAEDVDYTNWEYPVASVSETGTLIYHAASGAGRSEIAWYSREGEHLEAVLPLGNYFDFALSNDGTKVVFSTLNDQSSGADLWIRNLERGNQSRLTFQAGDEFQPFWTPDDEWIYYGATEHGQDNIYRRHATGLGSHEELIERAYPQAIFPGGNRMLVEISNEKTGLSDIGIASIKEGTIDLLVATPFNDSQPALSPDGTFIAYTSDESGRTEVYVQSLEEGGKWQISTDGGMWPRWVGDEIFFMNTPRTELWTVPVMAGSGFELGTPKKLIEAQFQHGQFRPYDVSADGERILANTLGGMMRSTPLTLVENWFAPYLSQLQ